MSEQRKTRVTHFLVCRNKSYSESVCHQLPVNCNGDDWFQMTWTTVMMRRMLRRTTMMRRRRRRRMVLVWLISTTTQTSMTRRTVTMTKRCDYIVKDYIAKDYIVID